MEYLKYLFQSLKRLLNLLFSSLSFLTMLFQRLYFQADIGMHVKIPMFTKIDGKVKICSNVSIGKDVEIKGNVTIGRGCCIDKDVFIMGNIFFDEKTVVGSYTFLKTMPDGEIHIGKDVLINTHSNIGASKLVTVGNHSIFASYIQITDASHGFDDDLDLLIKHAPFISDSIHIGENVWLGSGVVVLKGVNINNGAVVGAKSLVTKDLSENSVSYGVPAKFIRNRCEPKINAV